MNYNTKKRKKTASVITLLGFTSLVLMVATYAWFIGITQVAVDEFEIEVKSSEGLTISLDAKTYGASLILGEDEITTDLTEYTSNTNHWARDLDEHGDDNGLIPISTSGEMDQNNSVLKVFSKSSVATINGQYMIRSEQMPNGGAANGLYDNQEQAGYIVFDMFIKNSSGENYSSTFDPLTAEAVYLLRQSTTYLEEEDTEAGIVGGDGVENSIRVAFMQVGRVDMKSTTADAQSITCSNGSGADGATVTGLCNVALNETTSLPEVNVKNSIGLTWNVWEPNEKAHSAPSIEYFGQACKKRTGIDTYSGSCDALQNGVEYDTHTIKLPVGASDHVNLYDAYNGYYNLDPQPEISSKMDNFDTFTDEDKMLSLDEKQIFFYLAPNSVTKVRVYIYLEGQDIDNYDMGAVGRKIKMTFGFTKDRYEGIE